MLDNWILAIRPKTLFASVAPVILGLAVSYHLQHQINLLVAVLTLICALLMQIASNLATDYLDFKKGIDTKERLGPIRVTSMGLIPLNTMKRALFLILGLSFLLGLFLMIHGGAVITIMGLSSIYFAYGYSGGPFPLSHNGLGEVAAFVFFGLVAVSGTTYLQTHAFDSLSLSLALGPGFISATILAINNLRDIKSDTETNKRTIAVRFGESFQRKLCLFLIVSSSLILISAALVFHIYGLLIASFIPLLFKENWKHILYQPIDPRMNLALAKTAKYLLLYCVASSIVLIFSK